MRHRKFCCTGHRGIGSMEHSLCGSSLTIGQVSSSRIQRRTRSLHLKLPTVSNHSLVVSWHRLLNCAGCHDHQLVIWPEWEPTQFSWVVYHMRMWIQSTPKYWLYTFVVHLNLGMDSQHFLDTDFDGNGYLNISGYWCDTVKQWIHDDKFEIYIQSSEIKPGAKQVNFHV